MKEKEIELIEYWNRKEKKYEVMLLCEFRKKMKGKKYKTIYN